MEREVRDADAVAVLVAEDPVGGADHVARPRHALVVHDVERDDPGRRRRAGVAARGSRGQAGHHRPVAEAVAAGVVRERGQVHRGEDAVAEVHAARVDSRVDQRDRRRVAGRAEVVEPHRALPELALPALRGAEVPCAVEDDRVVRRDREARQRREPGQVPRADPAGHPTDQISLELAAPYRSSARSASRVPSELRTITPTEAFGCVRAARASDGARKLACEECGAPPRAVAVSGTTSASRTSAISPCRTPGRAVQGTSIRKPPQNPPPIVRNPMNPFPDPGFLVARKCSEPMCNPISAYHPERGVARDSLVRGIQKRGSGLVADEVSRAAA